MYHSQRTLISKFVLDYGVVPYNVQTCIPTGQNFAPASLYRYNEVTLGTPLTNLCDD